MGLYRDETGQLIEVEDRYAEARGYEPAAPLDLGHAIGSAAEEARADDRGVVGGINAAATRFASGLTLGGTDVLLGETLTPLERERVLADVKAHPYLSAGGEIAGAVTGALAAPGSAAARTPTGYLSAIAQQGVEQGLARGGVRGVATALGTMGAEGALQSAGQYIGHASLEDKEVTAEGLAGALGTGFEFGTIGGGAALGVAKGAIAARRLYSRVMDGGKAAKAAESAWSNAAQESLEADQANLRIAETKASTTNKAKMEAQRYRNEARAMTQEEKIRAASAEPRPTEADFEAGVPTDVFERPAAAVEGPEPLIDVGEQPAGLVPTKAFKPESTEVIPVKKLEAKSPPTELEGQLAGTKAKLDEGKSIKQVGEEAVNGAAVSPQVPPSKTPKPYSGRNPSSSIEDWLGEKAAFDAGELSQARRVEDIKGARDLRMQREETLGEIRYKATEDLLGPQIAKEDKRIADAVAEVKAAHKDFEELLATGKTPAEDLTRNATPGGRKGIAILDDAHEEALLRAKYAADPVDASKALSEAEELENLLQGLAVDLTPDAKGVSRAQLRSEKAGELVDDLMKEIGVVKRVEKASAELADVLAEQAHPTSVMRAKGLREAEREAERKMYDRTARAVDDAETFGPEYKTPKERVRYARERQNEAQSALDEAKVQHEEASNEFASAQKKVKEGERAKKAALRLDNKAAAKAGKLGAADAGGMLEILDLPGLPKPSDLPVVGPLLGAYLKFRTLKRAMGRLGGRIPATADAKVAALANQTRDRIARAVDRSLGLLERGAKGGARVMPPVAGILSRRIYDDGGENPPKSAPIQKLAAARMREISAYVSTPGAIEMSVRRELRGVTDPDVIVAAEKHRRAMMEYMLKNMPKMPDQGLLNNIPWEPSPAQSMSFARRLDALGDPGGVYERLAEQQAMLSLEAAEVMRDVYPKLFQQAQQRVLERAAEANMKVPHRTRIQMAVLYKLPELEPSLDPANFQITQSVYERKPSSPAYNPQAPGVAPQAPTAQPAIAAPINFAEAFTPAIDRR